MSHMTRATLALCCLAAPAANAFAPPRSGVALRSRPAPPPAAAAEDLADIAFSAFEWTANLGAPAALVAGAVMATSTELRQEGSLITRKSDRCWVRQAKKLIKVLLVGSFAFEVLSVFVSTVTGTMLLSVGERTARRAVEALPHLTGSPMGYLQANHEFEYLTCRISFVQGLMQWLGAVALKYAIPQPGEGEATKKMNRFVGMLLASTMVLMVSFYNTHMNFYKNYWCMIARWMKLSWRIFVGAPVEPLIFLAGVPCVAFTAYLGYQAFTAEPDEPDE